MAIKKSFSDQLRHAIEASEMSRYAMAKLTGIPQSQLSRFVHGQSGLAVGNIDKLCALLGLQLVGPAKPKSNPKAKGK